MSQISRFALLFRKIELVFNLTESVSAMFFVNLTMI